MTTAEALTEAKKRWGPFAFATPKREWRGYRVGVLVGRDERRVMGYSLKSFEAAFAKAAAKETK